MSADRSTAESARARPRRVVAAIAILVGVAALALLFTALNVIGYFGSAEYQGIATRMSFIEFIADAPEQMLIPIGVALAAGAAAVGMGRRREWGRRLAFGMALAILLEGLFLIVSALREWSLPGSFAALLIPPAIVLLLVGAYLTYASVTTSEYFKAPGVVEPPDRRDR